jgi:hypothetical protein
VAELTEASAGVARGPNGGELPPQTNPLFFLPFASTTNEVPTPAGQQSLPSDSTSPSSSYISLPTSTQVSGLSKLPDLSIYRPLQPLPNSAMIPYWDAPIFSSIRPQGTGLLVLLTLGCGLGFLLFGYDQGVMGGESN